MLRNGSSSVRCDHTPAPATSSAAAAPLQDGYYWADYIATAQRLIADFKVVTASCAISAFGMRYANETVNVESDGAFFPAAAWLRAFFHDAGRQGASDTWGYTINVLTDRFGC